MGGVLSILVHCLSFLIQLSYPLTTSEMLEPQIYQLSVGQAFDSLSDSEKCYAHYMARYWQCRISKNTELTYNIRAAWSGTRIILRQVSPEANDIFDFIIALYHACGGNWEKPATKTQVDSDEVERFLNYAAMFLSNVGNYFVSGMCVYLDYLITFVRRALEIRRFCRGYLKRVSRSWRHSRRPPVVYSAVSKSLCLQRRLVV